MSQKEEGPFCLSLSATTGIHDILAAELHAICVQFVLSIHFCGLQAKCPHSKTKASWWFIDMNFFSVLVAKAISHE